MKTAKIRIQPIFGTMTSFSGSLQYRGKTLHFKDGKNANEVGQALKEYAVNMGFTHFKINLG